ncbi:uncharacterized protein TRAVEDRAFT_52321 [Trametes versicolor FP-101664 SS1]|uniref:uncharacterized protein n=1 Tax=Trametes versicolor (strain FP-101664) TaxID=717944 RepID=UPI0004622AFC|nr:uncharacterized protein TRAVEDRAFT_52321 [Trametes versicolor FP-101664 SS1]EIW53186.1 hypothetical protein TRAVEDRAFT_52321 [Trametes versicolor FP-101664 SS1]
MEPLTRTEKLTVLASMGIELPEDTKLVDAVLEKRLVNALDAAQGKDRCPDPSKLRELPMWPLVKTGEINSSARLLLDAVKRGNMHEARQNSQAALLGLSASPELFTDPFMDLRQTHMSLANGLDNGFMWCTIQDPDREKSAINIRFLKVHEIDTKTPAMVLLYHSVTRTNAMDGARWCQYQVANDPKTLRGIGINISATALEQKLLLKLLEMNTKLLPPDFRPEKRRFEDNYRASVGSPSTPHANVHADKPFLVKLQVGLAGPGRDNIVVYDRLRSFSQVYVSRRDDPATFADLVAEMAGPRGGYGGVKMYRWAKRTGDWELSICVDRKPETDIKW